jgi:2'-5' RNA ligase
MPCSARSGPLEELAAHGKAVSPYVPKVSGNYSARMGTARLVRHHATVLLDPERSKPVEILRSRWDPQMSQQIAAHVTLIYPEEVADPAELDEVVRAAVARTAPFRVALREAFFAGSPADGVFLHVEDVDGGIASFRTETVPAPRAIEFPPHVTIVHPRTSVLGEQAWRSVAATHLRTEFMVTEVATTASDGNRWQIVQRLPLTGRPA